jgi:hypothetical protein
MQNSNQTADDPPSVDLRKKIHLISPFLISTPRELDLPQAEKSQFAPNWGAVPWGTQDESQSDLSLSQRRGIRLGGNAAIAQRAQ